MVGLQTRLPVQLAQAAAGHSQAHAVALQVVPSGQPPQSAGQAQAQLLLGSHWPAPPQAASQPGSHAHSQVEVLHT